MDRNIRIPFERLVIEVDLAPAAVIGPVTGDHDVPIPFGT